MRPGGMRTLSASNPAALSERHASLLRRCDDLRSAVTDSSLESLIILANPHHDERIIRFTSGFCTLQAFHAKVMAAVRHGGYVRLNSPLGPPAACPAWKGPCSAQPAPSAVASVRLPAPRQRRSNPIWPIHRQAYKRADRGVTTTSQVTRL